MGVTAGAVLMGIGIIGSAVSIAVLCVMEKNWKTQRAKLLSTIESED